MGATDDIFNEYTQMRKNGLDARATLKALRQSIEPISRADKEGLAQQMRLWEKELVDAQKEASQPKKSSVIKPIAAPAALWIECRNCDKKNRAQDVFCYSCGHLLQHDVSVFDTRQFADATDALFSDDYFGPDSVLVLVARDKNQMFELRPQARNYEMVVGRGTDNSAMRPDVDLSENDGAEMGVSRLHLAVRFEPKDNTIQIYDLGSANGSFVNGQRLHPREVRLLRNHDELRLGRLVLRVHYQHPGEEISSGS
jgi:hypothetical protein